MLTLRLINCTTGSGCVSSLQLERMASASTAGHKCTSCTGTKRMTSLPQCVTLYTSVLLVRRIFWLSLLKYIHKLKCYHGLISATKRHDPASPCFVMPYFCALLLQRRASMRLPSSNCDSGGRLLSHQNSRGSVHPDQLGAAGVDAPRLALDLQPDNATGVTHETCGQLAAACIAAQPEQRSGQRGAVTEAAGMLTMVLYWPGTVRLGAKYLRHHTPGQLRSEKLSGLAAQHSRQQPGSLMQEGTQRSPAAERQDCYRVPHQVEVACLGVMVRTAKPCSRQHSTRMYSWRKLLCVKLHAYHFVGDATLAGTSDGWHPRGQRTPCVLQHAPGELECCTLWMGEGSNILTCGFAPRTLARLMSEAVRLPLTLQYVQGSS